jgi:hypothetical protein
LESLVYLDNLFSFTINAKSPRSLIV